MRVWYAAYMDKEFHDALADPFDPMLVAMAQDALRAQGWQVDDDDAVIDWGRIPFAHGDLRAGDYILRIGFREADERRRETTKLPDPRRP